MIALNLIVSSYFIRQNSLIVAAKAGIVLFLGGCLSLGLVCSFRFWFLFRYDAVDARLHGNAPQCWNARRTCITFVVGVSTFQLRRLIIEVHIVILIAKWLLCLCLHRFSESACDWAWRRCIQRLSIMHVCLDLDLSHDYCLCLCSLLVRFDRLDDLLSLLLKLEL